MFDSEFVNEIREIAAEYVNDTDHWADYFMEKVVDVVNKYDKSL